MAIWDWWAAPRAGCSKGSSAWSGECTRASSPPAPAHRRGRPGRRLAGSGSELRIAVKLDDNLVVRNRTVSLRLGGVLSVEGSTAAPAVLGILETREGRVTFRDRRFTIITATARFVDPRRVDPFVDAVATARIREYDVTVRVTGASTGWMCASLRPLRSRRRISWPSSPSAPHAPSSNGRPPASSPRRPPGPSCATSWASKACREWVAATAESSGSR